MICDRSIHDDELASQPTLSRFENAIAVPNFWRLREMLIDPFIAAFDEAPAHLTVEIDPFDKSHARETATDVLPWV